MRNRLGTSPPPPSSHLGRPEIFAPCARLLLSYGNFSFVCVCFLSQLRGRYRAAAAAAVVRQSQAFPPLSRPLELVRGRRVFALLFISPPLFECCACCAFKELLRQFAIFVLGPSEDVTDGIKRATRTQEKKRLFLFSSSDSGQISCFLLLWFLSLRAGPWVIAT